MSMLKVRNGCFLSKLKAYTYKDILYTLEGPYKFLIYLFESKNPRFYTSLSGMVLDFIVKERTDII